MRKFNQRGVTLIELIIAMSIMVIFAVVVLPGFKQQTPQQAVEQSALEIQSSIMQAKTLALAPKSKYAEDYTQYFGVTVVPASHKVIIKQYYGTTTPLTEKELTGFEKRLPISVDISSSFNNDLRFAVAKNEILFNGSANPAGNPDNYFIEISSGSSRHYRVNIDPLTGRTEINKVGS